MLKTANNAPKLKTGKTFTFTKLVKLSFFTLFFICMFSNCFYLTSNNKDKNMLKAQTGSYIFTAVAVTGSQISSAGGRVQINGGTISGQESLLIPYFTSTTIQAYANVGYEFSGWFTAILGGQLRTKNATFTFNMPSENTTYYAIFAVNYYNISVVSSPSGAGNITGAGSYSYNSNVNITATPINNNYEFFRYIENSVEVSNNPSYAFTVTQNRNLIAEFRVKLTVNVVGGGSVEVNSQQGFTSGYFVQTQNIVLQAIPQPGYEFVGWSNASVSTSPTIQVLVGTVAKTYVANFSLIGAYLFVNATQGGSVAGTSTAGTYPQGEVVNLVATPSVGYHFLYWQGQFSGHLEVDNPITSYIVMLSDVIRGNITLTAVFERDYVNLNLHATVNGVITSVGGLVKIANEQGGHSVTKFLLPESQVQITATKQNGYKFVGWYNAISGGQLISQNETFSLTVPIIESSFYARFLLSYWHEYRIMPLGLGTQEAPYIISTENELAWLAYATNTGFNFSSGVYAKQIKHLNLSAYMWEPIGNGATLSANSKWQGVFDGGGYTISGISINKQQNQVSYTGLFGAVYGNLAKIINLGLENVNVVSHSNFNTYIGAFAGQLEMGAISACYVKNVIINAINSGGHQYVGGLVGANTNGKINNCYVFGNFTGNSTQQDSIYMGGVAGNNYGTGALVENCYSICVIETSLENNGKSSIYVGASIGYNSISATIKGVFYSLDETALNLTGTNNANIIGGGGKLKQELKTFSNYVGENNNWNFESYWFLPASTKNEGLPILRGVGNLIINSHSGENGSVTPIGQSIYFYNDEIPLYVITPNKNYRIKTLKVNDAYLSYYENQKNAQSYEVKQSVGQLNLEAQFEPIPKEPLDYIFLALLFITPTSIIFYSLFKMLRKKRSRKQRIKGAIKNYKKNRNWFIKFKK